MQAYPTMTLVSSPYHKCDEKDLNTFKMPLSFLDTFVVTQYIQSKLFESVYVIELQLFISFFMPYIVWQGFDCYTLARVRLLHCQVPQTYHDCLTVFSIQPADNISILYSNGKL